MSYWLYRQQLIERAQSQDACEFYCIMDQQFNFINLFNPKPLDYAIPLLANGNFELVIVFLRFLSD